MQRITLLCVGKLKENFYAEAVGNFSSLGLSGRVTAVCGDAGEEIQKLTGEYSFIFLEAPVPQKRRMLYTHIKEYIDAVTHDAELKTTIVNAGDGLAVSVKI